MGTWSGGKSAMDGRQRDGFPDVALPPAKVLIVDDDERNAFAAVEALEGLNIETVVARSGADALRALLREEFAVILLDLHMPGMDGYETAQLIRTHRKTAHTPIVFLTAIFRDEAHVFQAYAAGAVDLVFKPVDPFILRAKVSVFVDLHMKTEAARRLAAHRQSLLEENARIQAEKASAEGALKRSEARQQAIMQCLPIVFHARKAEAPFAPTFVSESVHTITGFPSERFVEQGDFGSSRIHPEDLNHVVEKVSAAVHTGAYSCEFRWLCADGEYRYLLDQGVLAPGDETGEPQIYGVILDSTDRHALEEQLTQARKMEAVGQLTGGVAHDFNNFLMVILGNLDLLNRPVDDETKRERRVGAIRQAAEKARDLTRQLLAFSRSQKLSPLATSLNQLVTDFSPLLQRAIGEGVTLDLQLDPTSPCAHVDVTQLETALLNLAVNARDAMGARGTMTVSTFHRPPGTVGISVGDEGPGMSAEVRERIFEPFFTTKPAGHGSGLGLSQVYGFIQQSNGQVLLETAPGQGARFELLLPASAEPARVRPQNSEIADVRGGSEKVLIVEDDSSVRSLTAELLEDLGYRVSIASNGGEALHLLRNDPSIDLLFSDVVMPGDVNGIDLANAAQAERPELKVLLASGFLGSRKDVDQSKFQVLDKPYDARLLATSLHRLLNPIEQSIPRKSRVAAKARGR